MPALEVLLGNLSDFQKVLEVLALLKILGKLPLKLLLKLLFQARLDRIKQLNRVLQLQLQLWEAVLNLLWPQPVRLQVLLHLLRPVKIL